jgi:TetR/AcrR family transcriptional regulator
MKSQALNASPSRGSRPQRRGSRRQPEASRAAILKAALAEFAQQGLAGARMDAIASAAEVNKALLYYYFGSKDGLYTAVLDDFFQRLRERIHRALDTSAPLGERILLYARAHFDSVAESPYYARLFQGEMMNASREASPHLSHIVEDYIAPIATRVGAVLEKGIRHREFRAVDPLQFAPTMAATIVFYFVSSPVMRRLRGVDPYAAEAIAQRRAAVLDFIAAALFVDRDAGLKLAREIAVREPEDNEPGSSITTTLLSDERGRRK